MNIIKRRNVFLGFSGALVLLSLVLVFTLGLREGIDLKGGTQWQIVFDRNATTTEVAVKDAIRSVSQNIDVSVKESSDGSFIIRLPETSEVGHQAYKTALGFLGNFKEQSSSSIGPTIGSELRTKSIWAIILVLVGISLYIAYAFRKVSRPVSSWKYGLVTLITLFHDVSIPTGLLAYLGWARGIEIDTNFIVALLVVMGFSVHDTIVVFDRIRENLLTSRGKMSLGDIIDKSVHETFARSINTSLTLILVLVALLIFGPPSLFFFILTILVGTVFGTYSSIFIASPLLYLAGRSVDK